MEYKEVDSTERHGEKRESALSFYDAFIRNSEVVRLMEILKEYDRFLREKIRPNLEQIKKSKRDLSEKEYESKINEHVAMEKDLTKKFWEGYGFQGGLGGFDECQRALDTVKKTFFGFDDKQIEDTLKKFNEFFIKTYNRPHSIHEFWHHETSRYIPLVSVILKIYGGDLRGVKIVEIGSGREGAEILRFFKYLGAEVVGIDVNPNHQTADGIVRQGEWQHLSKILPENSVDIIFTHHMTPVPYVGTEFDSNPEGFFKQCYEEMDKCLKTGGVLIGHSVVNDIRIGNPSYYDLTGYQTVDLWQEGAPGDKGYKTTGSITLSIKGQ